MRDFIPLMELFWKENTSKIINTEIGARKRQNAFLKY